MFELLSERGGAENSLELLETRNRQKVQANFESFPLKKDKINSVSVSDKPKKQVNNDEDRNGKFEKHNSSRRESRVSEIDKKCWITKEKQKKSSKKEKLNKFCS